MLVNSRRLFERILELGEIGKQDSGGVTSLAFSKEDNAALELVASYMKRAGLKTQIDAAGNLIGRREGRDPKARVVMTGSHIDTVYEGGMFDGRLGVLAAIEALEAMQEHAIETLHPIEIGVYRDEEGVRFSMGYSGASHMAGKARAGVLDATDPSGTSVAEALKHSGIDPERVALAKLPEGYAKAHVELHIEQGKVLESEGLSVGIVSGIFCQTRGTFRLSGEAGHAGTPMRFRRDPLSAAAEIVLSIERQARNTGTTVATVGSFSVRPGGINIIPGSVEFTLNVRDQKAEVRDSVLANILRSAEEICARRDISVVYDSPGVHLPPKFCDEALQQTIGRVCSNLGLPVFGLPSPAGHDSNFFADICPMAMIFVRSRGGISHSPAEWSSEEDCALGAEVLLHTLLELACVVSSAQHAKS